MSNNFSKSCLKKENPVPLYYQIKHDIEDKIKNNVLKEGTYLPSEFKLMEEYNVSRPTIRQAIDVLVQEEYVEKIRGIGTIVRKPKPDVWDLTQLRSFNEEAQRKGFTTRTKLLDFKVVPRDSVLCSIFGEKYDNFYKLKRFRLIDNNPTELVTTYVPQKIVPELEKYDFSKNSLFYVMQNDYNIDISYAEKTFKAINVSKEDAKLLEIPHKSAIQLVTTITYTSNKFPIEYSISKNKGLTAKFKLIIDRTNL